MKFSSFLKYFQLVEIALDLKAWECAFNDFTAQKMKFSIKDFFSKCDQIWFGHIYWRNPSCATSFFVQCF